MSGGVVFDIDLSSLEDLANRLGLAPEQIYAAFGVALRRTQSKLRMDAIRALKPRLSLRTTGRLKNRIKVFSSRRAGEVTIWFGENDMPFRDFKGTPKRSAGGLTFRDRSYLDAFMMRPKGGGPAIAVRRVGVARFPVEKLMLSVKDEMDEYMQGAMMDMVAEVLLRNFEHEIKARGIFEVGR